MNDSNTCFSPSFEHKDSAEVKKLEGAVPAENQNSEEEGGDEAEDGLKYTLTLKTEEDVEIDDPAFTGPQGTPPPKITVKRAIKYLENFCGFNLNKYLN